MTSPIWPSFTMRAVFSRPVRLFGFNFVNPQKRLPNVGKSRVLTFFYPLDCPQLSNRNSNRLTGGICSRPPAASRKLGRQVEPLLQSPAFVSQVLREQRWIQCPVGELPPCQKWNRQPSSYSRGRHRQNRETPAERDRVSAFCNHIDRHLRGGNNRMHRSLPRALPDVAAAWSATPRRPRKCSDRVRPRAGWSPQLLAGRSGLRMRWPFPRPEEVGSRPTG